MRPKLKHGIEVPCHCKDTMRLDKQNKDKLWGEATKTEMKQVNMFEVFKDHGLNAPVPKGHRNIRVHLIFDIKHDGQHQATPVADGHLTNIPVDSVYSGVVSLRGFRILLFLAELNGLRPWSTNVAST